MKWEFELYIDIQINRDPPVHMKICSDSDVKGPSGPDPHWPQGMGFHPGIGSRQGQLGAELVCFSLRCVTHSPALIFKVKTGGKLGPYKTLRATSDVHTGTSPLSPNMDWDNLKPCGNYISIFAMLFCMINSKFAELERIYLVLVFRIKREASVNWQNNWNWSRLFL